MSVKSCQNDLLSFVQGSFDAKGTVFKTNWHHKTMCDTLEKVMLGNIQRLIINVPPRYSKTEIAGISFIAWCLGWFPDSEFIYVSYTKTLAERNTSLARDIVMSDFYKNIFPDTRVRKDSKAKDNWSTTAGGRVYAAGSDGTITGYGAGKMRDEFGGAIIIDDPHKIVEINSATQRQNVIDWYHNTLESRVNSEKTPIILIMQRVHQQDLSGHLLHEQKSQKWEHICIPAILPTGEALWPYKHSLEQLEGKKLDNPYEFSSQYMQEPSPAGGSVFKNENWNFYNDLPVMKYRIITADTAQKTKSYNDYTVIQCWGKFENKAYLIDQIRGKWESPKLKKIFMQFWEKHKGYDLLKYGALRKVYIEDKVSGTALIQEIAEQGIPVKGLKRTVDKLTRAYDIAPSIAAGRVIIPANAKWTADYLMEFSNFTPKMTHKHDDQIDASMDAVSILLNINGRRASMW